MEIQKLDFIFPFVVFAYGVVVLLVLNNPKLVKIAETRLPSDIWARFQTKRVLAYVCFFVGGLWALQNIWFS